MVLLVLATTGMLEASMMEPGRGALCPGDLGLAMVESGVGCGV